LLNAFMQGMQCYTNSELVLLVGHVGGAAARLIDRLGDLRSFTVDQTQLAPQLRITHHDEYPELGVTCRRGTDGGVEDFRHDLVRHWIRFESAQRPRQIHRLEQSSIAHGDLPIEWVKR